MLSLQKQIFFRKETTFHDLLQKNDHFCHDNLAGGQMWDERSETFWLFLQVGGFPLVYCSYIEAN